MIDTDAMDQAMMQRALQVALGALFISDPNPHVGCVIVRDGVIVGEGFTGPVGSPHAEVNALRAAGSKAEGATVYVTLEPCSHHGRTPPCVDALIAARVARVVYAIGDPNPLVNGPLVNGQGRARLLAAGIAVQADLLRDAAREANIGFFTRMTQQRPWVTVKLGMSIDGKVALANGVSQWISSESSRKDVQRWRARSSAILTGVGTVLADDPRLTVRADDIDMQGRKPLRVVCDSHWRMPLRSKLLSEQGGVLIVGTTDDDRADALRSAGAEVVVLPEQSRQVDLSALMQVLAQRGCNEVFVEAGPTLSGRLIELGLVDELLLYMAPVILGAPARSMLQLPEITTMQSRWQFNLYECKQIASDLRLRFRK